MDATELRDAVPMFARVEEAVLRRIAGQLTVSRVDAGTELVRQGDPGNEMYIVRSGRLEVEVDEQVVRTAGRGEVVGEFALLGAGGRTATVRATRDAELLVLSRRVFDSLLSSEPTFARALIVDLSERIPRADPATTATSGGVLTVVPAQLGLAAAPVIQIAEGLRAELSRWHSVRAVSTEDWSDHGMWAGHLDLAERANQWVLLVATEREGPWRTFCERQADRIVAVVDPSIAAPAIAVGHAGQVELAVLGNGRLPVAAFSSHVRTHHVVEQDSWDADIACMARRMAGRSIGLVLSGGGARGMAHIGVLSALEDAGVRIDRLGGTSMGAFIGGLATLGKTSAQIQEIARRELVERNPFRDYSWPKYGLIRGARAEMMLDRVFGSELIERQRRRFFCVSADLVAAEEVVHRHGRIAHAVGLSMRLPGVVAPKWIGTQLHVDGGVLSNLPVDVLAADGEGPVIAVDVMRPFVPSRRGVGHRVPGIVDTLGRAIVLGSWRKAELARAMASIVVTPQMDGVGMFDFEQLDDIVRMGRAAAEHALADAYLPV